MQRAVANGGVNGFRFKNPIQKVAVKKMDVSAAKFTRALTFQEPARKLRGQIYAE